MIVAIVQARLGSTRLPGKTLADIAGKPMIQRVVDRLQRSRTIDKVAVATTRLVVDEPLASFCLDHGIAVHRGPEIDVLSRYFQAATAEAATTIVRITGDCPLIDPKIVDDVVYALEGADYASNFLPPRMYPRGLDVEAFSYQALARAYKDDQSGWREHVTPYLYRSGLFRCNAVWPKKNRAHHRWTVDQEEDLELVRTIYHYFGHDHFDWLSLVAAWRPEWTKINAHVKQKEVA